MNNFYVYEWYIENTGEVFYVGKGTGNRYLEYKRRNKMFKDFYKTHKCSVRKVYENLTEEQAFEKEVETIKFYKENTNYRITNQTDGGSGGNTHKYYTGERLKEYLKKCSTSKKGINKGTKNPMYGKTWKDGKSPEEIKIISDKIRKANIGKKRSIESKKKMSESAKKRKPPKPRERKGCMIVEKETFKLIALFEKIGDAKKNGYVKGNDSILSRKAKGLIENKNEKYYIFYTSYKIDEKELHPKIN